MPKVAIVTGGTRGIGAAIAKALKKAGYNVAVNYGGNDDAAKAFKKETKIPVFKWDVGDYVACEQGIVNVENEVGPIEVLVNNAGISRDAMLQKMSHEQWSEVIRTNLDSLFNMTRPIINAMRASVMSASRTACVSAASWKRASPWSSVSACCSAVYQPISQPLPPSSVMTTTEPSSGRVCWMPWKLHSYPSQGSPSGARVLMRSVQGSVGAVMMLLLSGRNG